MTLRSIFVLLAAVPAFASAAEPPLRFDRDIRPIRARPFPARLPSPLEWLFSGVAAESL